MSSNDGNGSGSGGGNRTVFRPSPLQGLQQPTTPFGGTPSGQSAWGEPSTPQPVYTPPPTPRPMAASPVPSARLSQDDIPLPSQPQLVRNRMMLEAGPILALAASVRCGRARTPLVEFHAHATAAIAGFDRAIAGLYPDEMRQRAKYALCSTLDDIAQNLPGNPQDAAEWARRSMVVQTFQENIGGDRFWQLVEDMLARPAQQADLVELFHACLAAGFEGRFRVMADGKRRLHEIMNQLYGSLEFPRSLSNQTLVPHWKGEVAPLRRVGFLSYIALAAAIAAGVLLVIYVVLRLLLLQSGTAPWEALSKLTPDQRLTLSRDGAPPPAVPASPQSGRLKQFLAQEIAQKLVVVVEDNATVRVRTTVGQLFKSGSDELEPGREELFHRIGKALETEKGPITVEGHSDSDKISSLAFPDNVALSGARANSVASIIAGELSDPGRIEAKAFGDTQPIGSNDNAAGKALNRRVEFVIPRQN